MSDIILSASDARRIADNANAFELTAEEAFKYLDAPGETELAEWLGETELAEWLEYQLDSAQGNIRSGTDKEAWIVIHIVK